jgi:uncharacterized protein (DUF433 family)
VQLEDYFNFEKVDTKYGVAEKICLKCPRVSLDTIVEEFNKGAALQEVAEGYKLTQEQVYAAVTYYLHNKEEVDEYLRRGRAIEEAFYQEYLEKGPYFIRDEALRLAKRPEEPVPNE